MTKKITLLALLSIISVIVFKITDANAVQEFSIEIRENKFVPDVLTVPEGERFKLVVKNLDKTPEEFESHDFNREKIIGGGKQAKILVGPLDKGVYKFFGEFNPKTAQGKLIVR